ncbi:MAG: EamA family transporter [Rhizobacter sp.]|nr:EamA family transporter [Chlorobiales bacterium]
MPAISNRVRFIAAFAAVYLIWGSTYLGIRYAIETLPPFLMAGARFLVAGVVMFLWAKFFGGEKERASLTPVHWKNAAIVGALLLLGGNGGVVWSEQRIASSIAALLIMTEPLWIVLLEWRRSGHRPPSGVAIGLSLGLIGTFVLIRPQSFLDGSAEHLDLLGVLVMTLSTFAWATGSLFASRAELPKSPVLTTAVQMLCGGVLLMAAGTLFGEWSQLNLAAVSLRSWLAWIYLTVFGSIIAFTAYNWILRNASPSLASTYAYVNPVIAVFLGWALGGELITSQTIFAALILVGAVVLITRASPSHAPKSIVADAPAKATSLAND